jgi:hypothetical protein
MGLARHLDSGAAVSPSEAAAWSASEEGKDFMRRTSAEWCKASIGAGTEESAARAAAARTAFYCGEPEPGGS